MGLLPPRDQIKQAVLTVLWGVSGLIILILTLTFIFELIEDSNWRAFSYLAAVVVFVNTVAAIGKKENLVNRLIFAAVCVLISTIYMFA